MPKNSNYFFPRPSRPIGWSSQCKECIRAADRDRYIKSPPKYRDFEGKQQCTRCKTIKLATTEFFRVNKFTNNGLDSWCLECAREWARNRQSQRRKDPYESIKIKEEKRKYNETEKGREYKKKRSQIDNHKRSQRCRQLEFNWSLELWENCVKYWDSKCAYCGVQGPVTQDHFIPIFSPNCPGTVEWNIVPACSSCNSSKQNKSAEIWCKDINRLNKIKEYLSNIQNKAIQ